MKYENTMLITVSGAFIMSMGIALASFSTKVRRPTHIFE